MCVCVCLDRQNPHLAFKTLQYQNIWASYDTLEKLSFKDLQESFSQEKRLAKASSIAPCHVCPQLYAMYYSRQAIYVQLGIAQCHDEFEQRRSDKVKRSLI